MNRAHVTTVVALSNHRGRLLLAVVVPSDILLACLHCGTGLWYVDGVGNDVAATLLKQYVDCSLLLSCQVKQQNFR